MRFAIGDDKRQLFSMIVQLRRSQNRTNAAKSSVFCVKLASQASDVGSIPIARSISLDDSIAFMRLSR